MKVKRYCDTSLSHSPTTPTLTSSETPHHPLPDLLGPSSLLHFPRSSLQPWLACNIYRDEILLLKQIVKAIHNAWLNGKREKIIYSHLIRYTYLMSLPMICPDSTCTRNQIYETIQPNLQLYKGILPFVKINFT